MITEERRGLLLEFLNRWPEESVKAMKLTEYNHLGNNDSFCYWIEHKTRDVGSIIGMPQTLKFGIYNHNDEPGKKRKKFLHDKKYVWLPAFGSTRNEAFREVMSEILQIVVFASRGDFEAIDDLRYTSFGKWKIAFLYSNERLIPIFKWSVLKKIVKGLGEDVNNDTPVSKVQEIIMSKKPVSQSVYDFSYDLWFKYSGQKEERSKRGRRGTKTKNTKPQSRSGSEPYIALQIHNQIQESLLKELCDEYGEKMSLWKKIILTLR